MNSSLEEEAQSRLVENVKNEAKSLLDEYEYDGNYIGDNPKYMHRHDLEGSKSEESEEEH